MLIETPTAPELILVFAAEYQMAMSSRREKVFRQPTPSTRSQRTVTRLAPP